jgi:hypothetical protein
MSKNINQKIINQKNVNQKNTDLKNLYLNEKFINGLFIQKSMRKNSIDLPVLNQLGLFVNNGVIKNGAN